jgi:hypothetical protein
MFDRWLEWTPPSLCQIDFGVTEALAAAGLAGGESAAAFSLPAALDLGGFGAFAPAATTSSGILGTGIGLGEVGTAASLGGTLLSANAGMDQAAYAAAVQRANAQALKDQANVDAATAERTQITRSRQTDLALSRSRALAAGSGTEATSPDVLNTEGQIAQQGTYNAQSAFYEGQQKSRSDQYQASIDLFNANRIESAAPLTAAGTLLSGISSFATNRSRLKYYSLGGGYSGF